MTTSQIISVLVAVADGCRLAIPLTRLRWKRLKAVIVIALAMSPVSAQAAVISYRLEFTDAASRVIDETSVGESVTLSVYVSDTRINPKGVFSAYLDVNYDSQLVYVIEDSLVHGDDFLTATRGDVSQLSTLDEVGAFRSTAGTLPQLSGGNEFLLWSIGLEAMSPGTALFTSDPADLLPRHETTVNGRNDAIRPNETFFGQAALNIVPEPAGAVLLWLATFFLLSQRSPKRRR